MSELCFSTSSRNQEFCILISDFILFICFNLAHPVHFSFFIFVLPYFGRLFPSFISLLFFSTFPLLASFGLFQDPSDTTSSSSKVSLLVSHYHETVERLHREIEDEPEEFNVPEDLEDYYKLLFDTSVPDTSVDIWNPKMDEISSEPNEASSVLECPSDQRDEMNASETFADKSEEIASLDGEERASSEVSFEEFNELESVDSNAGEKSSNPAVIADNAVADANGAENFGSKLERSKTETALECDLGSYGSMRKEKEEWKKTLACKLFEERRQVDGGGEGMDLLWETYELDSSKSNNHPEKKNSSKNKSKNKGKAKQRKSADYNDDDDEEMNAKIFCLQALKFSAGKMNLGMGRPNLVKISKAIKGLGWLHHVSSSSSRSRRSGKKVYNSEGL